MNIKAIAMSLALTGICTIALAQTTPGYDRPSNTPDHQHVVYWNDSMDHYDMDMQVAADAYSTADLHTKDIKKAEKRYDHKKRSSK